ncbi:conserved unknown protein [Ectocarpus siliculosus]|uniref:Anoctamin transmembrane domain-containing protein n=1 Tax=Ectocarpus siliculosus TaxID=2880 RepID=D7FW97_ECTSI|nr:conserved unknown protein [Ectocarpus siliculosus]|eukprot:CBJ25617.1 conserved unknown protein [Ectocarpus siliculosus]
MYDSDDESGGGVMIVFSADPEKQADVLGAIEYLTSALRAHQLLVTLHKRGEAASVEHSFLVVNATRRVMEVEAEHIKLMKPDFTGSLMEFHREGAADVFKGYDDLAFFTASEEALLVRSMVDSTQGGENPPKGVPTGSHSYGAVYALRLAGLVTEAMQAHRACTSRTRVWENCLYGVGADVKGVNNYFGPETAFYFAWINFYFRWLLVPGIAGLLVTVHKAIVGRETDNYRWTPLYALIVMLWAASFQKYWKRTCAEWSWKFGTALVSEEEILRAEFVGEERISPVTGEKERYYPTHKRLMRYCESVVVTTAMLLVALVFMICSLNLQGYMVLPEGDSVTAIESWFYVPWLSKFAEEGGAFDANGYYRGYIPASLGATVIHVLCIQNWNKVYRTVATHLTDRENHPTEEDYQNNLMIKRFLFEAFDCYVSLFYLAFVQFDMLKLRNELISLFTVDTIRRVATECIVPMITQTFSWDKSVLKENAERRLKVFASKTDTGASEAEQMKEEEYDSFDDYLEMVIQYGYMTLFASAFPFASTLSLLTTFVEIKSDTFKLLFLYKRPVPRRMAGIGNWQKVMDATTVIAVTTNCMLFALSSEQLMQWIPNWYLDHDGPHGPMDQEFQVGMGRYVVGLCFGVEHVLLAVVAILWMAIPAQPKWVRQRVARVHFLREKGARLAVLKKHD